MKNDLATTIITAVVTVVAAYFLCNMMVGKSDDFSFNTVDSSVSSDLALPDPELFNYKSLNPTVEVYVGNCTEINEYGECVDESSEQIEEGMIEDTDNSDNSSDSNSSNDSNSDQSPNNRRSNDNGITD